MAAVMKQLPVRRYRKQLVALVAVAALVAVYAYFAALLQPLGAGPDETLYRAPGQTTVNDPATTAGFENTHAGHVPLLLSYVDGAEASLVKTLYNDGPIPITITGVEISPSYLTGALVTIKEAQPAAITGPLPCSLNAVEIGAATLGYCRLDDAATWTGGAFRPIEVGPHKVGVVAVHLLMSHCEHGSGDGYATIDSIQVHYSVFGLPHDQSVDVGPYWFRSPDTCPRPRPANQ